MTDTTATPPSHQPKRNPRSNIPGGLSPHARFHQKKLSVLIWLYLWHHSTTGMIVEVCRVEPGFPADLARRGLVRSFDTPTLLGRQGWMLTADGIATAMAETGALLEYDEDLAAIVHRTLRHDLAVQRVVAGLSYRSFTPAEHTNFGFSEGVKRPDAVVVLADGPRAAIECELTKKRGRELDRSLWALAQLLEQGNADVVFYVSQSPALLQAYEAIIRKPLNEWRFDRAAGRWKIVGTKRLDSEVQEAFLFKHMPNILRGL
jgi:hypothetical protein